MGFAFADNSHTLIEQISQHQNNQQYLYNQSRQAWIQPHINAHDITTYDLQSHNNRLSVQPSGCLPIEEIVLDGAGAEQFQFALTQALADSQFHAGNCLNAHDINQIMITAQNFLIGRGYTTSRIVAAPQNLTSKRLVLTVLPGKIGHIRVNLSDINTTHANRIRTLSNIFPIERNRILRLYDLEQGLENLQRIPTAQVRMQITPSERLDESNIDIDWQQRLIPLRLIVALDNSGSSSTGQYQGSTTLLADNLLGLSDLAYLYFNTDLFHRNQTTTETNISPVKSGTTGYGMDYSLPWKNWLFSWNIGYYQYHQAVTGYENIYDYHGENWNGSMDISRTLSRNSHRKISLVGRLWYRQTRNFIDDAEISIQRKSSKGVDIELRDKEYFHYANLDLSLAYRYSNLIQGVKNHSEDSLYSELNNQQVIRGVVQLQVPLKLGQYAMSYDSVLQLQHNLTKIDVQNQISIGNRYTVRGFDGEQTLVANRGGYWQNNFRWQYHPNHQIYIGLDGGYAYGNKNNRIAQPQGWLVGGVVGIKGMWRLGGEFHYDVFVGKPIYYPKYFRATHTVIGFNLNYIL